MPRVLIWDLPVRAFHLVFAGGIATAACIALLGDDDGPLFPHHAMIGLTVAVALVLRIAWGFAGSRHARFASFAYGPRAVIRYMTDTLRGKGQRFAGHNPGAAHAAFAMYALLLLLTVSGITLALGNRDAKDAHEVFAYTMVAAIGAHLAGLALHTVTHREFIAASMVTGRKEADASEAITGPYPLVAAIFAAIVVTFAVALWSSYDASAATARIPVIGTQLALGENGEGGGEGGGEGHEGRRRGRDHRHDRDDD